MKKEEKRVFSTRIPLEVYDSMVETCEIINMRITDFIVMCIQNEIKRLKSDNVYNVLLNLKDKKD